MADPHRYRLTPDQHGVLTIDPLPDADALRRFYAEKYFQGAAAQYPGAYSADEIAYFHIRDRILEHALGSEVGASRILDIGCGEGFTCAWFHARGCEVFAADFSRAGFEAQNPETLGQIPFFQGDIVNDEVFPGERFDVIVANNVLEHVIDLYGFLERLHAQLRPGGMLYVQAPNEFNPLQRAWMARRGVTDPRDAPWFCPPEHIRYFTPDSLKRAVEASGFSLQRLMGDFPVELFLQHPATDYYSGDFGKAAHAVRVRTCNVLATDIGAYMGYCEAAIGLGVGRDMIGVFRRV